MKPYLLGVNILRVGKHKPKTYLRLDFSNGGHHSIDLQHNESGKGLAKALQGMANKLDDDPRLK